VGVAAVIAAVIGAIADPATFLRSYLWVYLFWLGWALGSLGIVLLHHLSGGGWGFGIRRIGEAAAMTLPLLAVLFLPILLGETTLFPWADPAAVAADPVMGHRAGAYTPFWFAARAILYFAVWIGTALAVRGWSVAQDTADDPASYTARFQKFCGIGLILYTVTMSLAIIDWVMTLEPHWYSTIFGLLTIVSQGLTGFAFAALAAAVLSRGNNLIGQNLGAQNLHDLGNLVFTFLLLWAYMAFSQFLITWSGNAAYEASWYLHRQTGGWWYIATAMILLHFFLPFVLLLFGGLKKHPVWLAGIAVVVLLARLLDSWWFVAPAFYQTGLHFGWMDLVLPFAVGAPCLALWARYLGRAALLPLRDPRMLLEPENSNKGESE
jgi:hypothetical protein